jgi:hypothetical protein
VRWIKVEREIGRRFLTKKLCFMWFENSRTGRWFEIKNQSLYKKLHSFIVFRILILALHTCMFIHYTYIYLTCTDLSIYWWRTKYEESRFWTCNMLKESDKSPPSLRYIVKRIKWVCIFRGFYGFFDTKSEKEVKGLENRREEKVNRPKWGLFFLTYFICFQLKNSIASYLG